MNNSRHTARIGLSKHRKKIWQPGSHTGLNHVPQNQPQRVGGNTLSVMGAVSMCLKIQGHCAIGL